MTELPLSVDFIPVEHVRAFSLLFPRLRRQEDKAHFVYEMDGLVCLPRNLAIEFVLRHWLAPMGTRNRKSPGR
jgi:hypothetical protein